MQQANIVIFDAQSRKWLRFTNPKRVIQTNSLSEVVSCLEETEEEIRRFGVHAVGFVSYEAAPAFDNALETHQTVDFPLLWFGIFDTCAEISLPPQPSTIRNLHCKPTISKSAYVDSIAAIKDEIREGNTYQVNHTFRLSCNEQVDPWELFLQMTETQQADYGAFLNIGEFAICSASPELFFRLEKGNLVSRPMKGTAPRGRFPEEDLEKSEWLLHSEKNRAENVMIVDMIRNDMSRVALPGSVHTPRLFSIEKYPTVWQMTSLVEAQTNGSVTDIFKAMFPCASVTGAPKASTMRIIRNLETSPRKIYTGAIGFIAPEGIAQFNVAIRTALWEKEKNGFEYGVGGGVVWQSDAETEYEECMVKSRVLTEQRPSFSLVETILYEPERGYFLEEAHLGRLAESAEYFDFTLDLDTVRNTLKNAALSFPTHAVRVRLLLERNGVITIEHTAFYVNREEPIRLRFAKEPINSDDVFLFHKTTNRAVYERALSMVQDCDDVLLWNEHGEITETTIYNVVVEKGEARWTPALPGGLLGGVFRSQLIREGLIQERVLTKDDVRNADRLFVINSVRKWREARLLDK
ncbi:MAG TPA: aminodeoxychorismate synthase component I [Bacteroidota bacterium]